ncbi:MAG: hypothetical protein JF593_08360 [Novosphingobium sp.]|nr:hypothetical protein [Novosphingobium sp.]
MTDPEDIRAWQRIGEQLTTSGRLEASDVPRLAALRVRHVINLALAKHPEALADEAALFAAEGIAYTHIPVPFDAPEDAHYDAFRAALEEEPGPVHVHCIMNLRVAAFLYRYNRGNGMAEAEARALMERQWTAEAMRHPAAAVWADFMGRR